MKKLREDYPELEGMEVNVKYYENNDKKAKVALVSRSIGLTILKDGSKTAIAFCLNKKRHVPELYDEEMYHKQFDYIVEMLEESRGTGDDINFDARDMDKTIGYSEEAIGGNAVCAFA